MTKYIIDSWAWIEYLLSTEKGLTVKRVLDNQENEIFTHALSLAEISSRLSRSGISYREHLDSITMVSNIVDINSDISARAGKLHSDTRKEIKDFGLIDAFVLLAVRDMSLKILTGDPHFKNIKEAMMI